MEVVEIDSVYCNECDVHYDSVEESRENDCLGEHDLLAGGHLDIVLKEDIDVAGSLNAPLEVTTSTYTEFRIKPDLSLVGGEISTFNSKKTTEGENQ